MGSYEMGPWPGLEELSQWLSARASDAETAGTGLAQEMTRLHQVGLLMGCVPEAFGGAGLGQDSEHAIQTFEILRRLGRASLPVARLFEGHLNAVKLVYLYGDKALQREVAKAISGGTVLGVWAADGRRPVTYELVATGDALLQGIKAFASGLDCVTQAIVSAKPFEGLGLPQLFLVDVTECSRQDAAAWNATGMQATMSGKFTFDGLRVPASRFVGHPGDYEKEPHFDGGVWRYCAAHIGGAEALLDATVGSLVARGHLEDPLQLARLGHAIAGCRAASALLRQEAVFIEAGSLAGPYSPEQAMAAALLAREFVAAMAIDILQACERCLGTSAHIANTPVERIRRDLSLYLRQAAPDAKLLKAARAFCEGGKGEPGLW